MNGLRNQSSPCNSPEKSCQHRLASRRKLSLSCPHTNSCRGTKSHSQLARRLLLKLWSIVIGWNHSNPKGERVEILGKHRFFISPNLVSLPFHTEAICPLKSSSDHVNWALVVKNILHHKITRRFLKAAPDPPSPHIYTLQISRTNKPNVG